MTLTTTIQLPHLRQIFAALQLTPQTTETKFLVAVSGGVDSMVLLEIVRQLFSPEQFMVVHIDHQLRPDSQAETQLLQAYTQKHHLQLTTHIWPVDQHPQTGIEQAAREFRLATYQMVGEAFGTQQVVLAHHADDQAETLLLKILRGGDWRQLAGLNPQRQVGSLTINRPLLDYAKQTLIVYAQQQGLQWVEDVTNQDVDYTLRNTIRLKLLPQLQAIEPNVVAHLNDYATQIRDVESGELVEMLKVWLQETAPGLSFKQSQLEQFERLLKNDKKPHGYIELEDGVHLVKRNGEITLERIK